MSTAHSFLDKHSVSAFLTKRQIRKVVDLLEDYFTFRLRESYSKSNSNDYSSDVKTKNKIFKLVEEYYNVELLAKTRKHEVVWARQVTCYLLRLFTKFNLRQIADVVGYRDHSNVVHAIATVKDNCNNYENYKSDVDRLKSILK